MLFYHGRQRIVDLNGDGVRGAKTSFYLTGSSTAAPVYADAGLSVELTQPVESDDAGFLPPIYLDPSVVYRSVTTDASGAALPDGSIDPVIQAALSQSAVGAALNPITDAESAALISSVNGAYSEGQLPRYGLVGDGATDDSVAFAKAAAVSAQGVKLRGMGRTYLLSSQLLLSGSFDLDLEGGSLKPSGNHLAINSLVTADVVAMISGTVTVGSRSLSVASAAGLSIGQWCFITYNDSPTNQSVSYPPSWAQITDVSGTTITFDKPFQLTYASGAATSQLNAFNTSTLREYCRIVNGTIDGSASTYNGAALGVAARIVGFKDVHLEVSLSNWNVTQDDDLITIFMCLTTKVQMRGLSNNTRVAQHINCVDVMSMDICNNLIDGDGFALAALRADSATVMGNTLSGRRKKNSDDATSPVRSVRAIKLYGCRDVRVMGNKCSDYESGIKIEACHGGVVMGNELESCGLEASYTGSVALNISQTTDGNFSGRFIISGNKVRNCGGIGIGLQNSTTVGKSIIAHNIIDTVQGTGILVNTADTIIESNRIENWGLRNSSDAAITFAKGATVRGNRFHHDTLTTLPCMPASFTSGGVYVFRDNAAETANPLFAGTLYMENTGNASISSGSTSVVVTHGLVIAPQGSEITLTFGGNPTNDVGFPYISSVTSTQFTINVRSDPGAGGLSIGWRAALRMPFTA